MEKIKNDWLKKVHEAMCRSDSRLTLDQMRALYGFPQGGVNIEMVLSKAVAAGWFEMLGRGYVALARGETPEPTWRYISNLRQVPSVFHLR